VWGLMRSMSKHMGKVDFKESAGGAEQTSGENAGGEASAAKS